MILPGSQRAYSLRRASPLALKNLVLSQLGRRGEVSEPGQRPLGLPRDLCFQDANRASWARGAAGMKWLRRLPAGRARNPGLVLPRYLCDPASDLTLLSLLVIIRRIGVMKSPCFLGLLEGLNETVPVRPLIAINSFRGYLVCARRTPRRSLGFAAGGTGLCRSSGGGRGRKMRVRLRMRKTGTPLLDPNRAVGVRRVVVGETVQAASSKKRVPARRWRERFRTWLCC